MLMVMVIDVSLYRIALIPVTAASAYLALFALFYFTPFCPDIKYTSPSVCLYFLLSFFLSSFLSLQYTPTYVLGHFALGEAAVEPEHGSNGWIEVSARNSTKDVDARRGCQASGPLSGVGIASVGHSDAQISTKPMVSCTKTARTSARAPR